MSIVGLFLWDSSYSSSSSVLKAQLCRFRDESHIVAGKNGEETKKDPSMTGSVKAVYPIGLTFLFLTFNIGKVVATFSGHVTNVMYTIGWDQAAMFRASDLVKLTINIAQQKSMNQQ